MASGFVTKASPNDLLAPAELNDLIGAPIFEDSVLWQSDAEKIAAKLNLNPESKTKTQSSFRAYPREDARLFGARPHSIALYAEYGMPTHFSLVFANKGDLFGSAGSGEDHFMRTASPKDVEKKLAEAMKADVDAITTNLSQKLGQPIKQRFGEGEGRRNVYRWDWRGHAILLSEVDMEYIGIEISTQRFADAGGKFARIKDEIVRSQAAANVERKENGDVVINDIPMVDQGPKGYCVPATAERAMRYLGVPADMYILAMAGETKIGGGTSVERLLEGVGKDIRRKGRSFDKWTGPLKQKDIAKYIDKGIPIIWAMCSVTEWNEIANERTRKRVNITDWSAWKNELTDAISDSSLIADRSRAHVVLIIGYNEQTGEIAFSDSWGERYTQRWMTLAEAERVSSQRFYVVSF